jgi:hypothetical protein
VHIAFCVPTRGIIFSDTVVSMLRELQLFSESSVYIVSGLPLPDAHNECVRKALQGKATHLFFLEEDVVIPDGGLGKMATAAANGMSYVHIEYPMENGTSVMRIGEQIYWTGLGCTLIDLNVFIQKGEPFFSNNKTVGYINGKMEMLNHINKYGGHDVLFGLWLKDKGIPITVIENMQAKHLRLATWERKTNNEGQHSIYTL